MIKIIIGADHQGVNLRDQIIDYLSSNEIEVEDIALENSSTDDYPDFAYKVSKEVLKNGNLGILICGTGIGMSIAANKVKGILCARVLNETDAFLAKNHNKANVIAMPSNINIEEMKKIIDVFIATKFPVEERHLRRIEKINKIENGTYNEL
ncbi:MAG: RpiB/LacA/LacB family sugar-phosphate isomerase [Bacilli bacterium]